MDYHSISLKTKPQRPMKEMPDGSLRIVQVTDSHLYADPDGTLVGMNTQESFARVLQLIRDIVWPADMILATGDLVHDASVKGYARMKEQLEQFGAPVYCLPGNHDSPNVMKQCLNHGLVSIPEYVQHDNWHLTFLDSTLPNHEGGHLNTEELEALKENLTLADGRNILISMHHHPVPIGSRWMDGISLDNAEGFFSIIDHFPNVRGIIWGHIHQSFDSQKDGIKLMGSPSTCIQFTPHKSDFGIDPSPPGFRWLELLPTGAIRTGVERLAALPEGVDVRSAGYR